MEQRPLRLGDILDDYCPRERRVTNHAIVAMVGDDVKQTRCSTCDAEHAYKGGKQPRRKKKDASSALYDEVLAGMPETEVAAAAVAADATPAALVAPAAVPSPVVDIPATETLAAHAAPLVSEDDEAVDEEQPGDLPPVEEGPVHRRLIRATLPRPEGVVKETRPIPEFTIHRNSGRGAQFRGGHHRGSGGNGNGHGNGHGQRSSGRRFAGGGGGNGSGYPGRGGQGRPGRGMPDAQRPGGGGKKRSR